MINPIEFSGMIPRTQDVSTLKQNEDVRPQFEHVNIQNKTEQEAVVKHEQVNEKDNADRGKSNYDAKEKGNGQYYNIRRKKDTKGKSGRIEDEADGVVIKKSKNMFDIQI